MTKTREDAIELLKRMPEDGVVYVLQIIQGIQGLYAGTDLKKKQAAFEELKKLQINAPGLDEKKELNEYREEKFENIS